MLCFTDDTSTISPTASPWSILKEWTALAVHSEPSDPHAAALATVNSEGAPTCRMVLLKHLGSDRLHFCTNALSRKGDDIRQNPQGALLLHWKSIRRQIRFEGRIEQLANQTAEDYFLERSRMSQLAACASLQSRPLASRDTLRQNVEEKMRQYHDQDVPRPASWVAYACIAHTIEFWLDGQHRLHQRLVFKRDEAGDWSSQLLYP